MNRKIQQRINLRVFGVEIYKSLAIYLAEHFSEFLKGDGVTISHSYTQQEFRHQLIEAIIDSGPDLKIRFEAITNYREAVFHLLENIREVAILVGCMQRTVAEIGKPVSFPEIFDDETHLIQFENLYPVHLIGRTNNVGKTVTGKTLIPVNRLAPLNGQMIVLTGANAGGKTSVKVELVNAIFLAQSGLPVFADSFGLNPKRVIGLVFVERGDGSLMELLLIKIKNILDELRLQQSHHFVVIVDELLTGTQEASGFAIGKQILKTFAESHASVIFSTQITGLAEYAVNEHQALPFAFDLEHKVTPGIAGGNPELLMKQLGMDKYLS